MSNDQHVKVSDKNVEPLWSADVATVINSICGYTSFALLCLALPLFLPIAFILPGGRRYWLAVAMRWAMRGVFAVTPTVTWRCDGDLNALTTARVIVSNHEGMLDILAACGLPGYRTLLAKTWVFKAFPLGVAARAAGICNSDLLTPDAYQEHAALTMPDEKIGLFVFPEGSRSRSGNMQRFRPGAFVLARHLQVPVVPVVQVGSRQGIRPGSMWIHPTHMRTRVLSAMLPHEHESHRQFAQRVRETIVEARRAVVIAMLEDGELMRHLRHRLCALTGADYRAAAAELREQAWQFIAKLPAHAGAWVFIGCGWSIMPMVVRLLYPEAAILVCDADAAHRRVAVSVWQRGGDQICEQLTSLSIPQHSAVIYNDGGIEAVAAASWLAAQSIAMFAVPKMHAAPFHLPMTWCGGWGYHHRI